MPSNSKPLWKGVDTDRSEAIWHCILENLKLLEESNQTMRLNIANIQNRANDNSSHRIDTEVHVEDDKILDRAIEKIKQNEEMGRTIKDVIEKNEDFKIQIQNYIRENENWEREQVKFECDADSDSDAEDQATDDLVKGSDNIFKEKIKSMGWAIPAIFCVCIVASAIAGYMICYALSGCPHNPSYIDGSVTEPNLLSLAFE